MLVEYMLAPPGAEEPQQLRAFWPDASAATPVPAQNTEVLQDFMFRLFATCMYTPECSVLAFMYVLRLLSYHPHLRVTPRNCQRLLLCSVMVAQKIHDDTPLRNVDFAVAWGRVRSRRPAVLRCLHAIDATRFHQPRSWAVSFSILGPFGPRRATAMLRAGTTRRATGPRRARQRHGARLPRCFRV